VKFFVVWYPLEVLAHASRSIGDAAYYHQ